MKIKSIVLGSFAIFLMVGNTVIAANTTNIDHFVLEASKTSIKTGEALDLTVKAVDKDNNIVKNYLGSVLIFSESDTNAEFPGTAIKDNTYKFTAADAGTVKFENAIKFSVSGKQDISVYDSENDSILGKTEITVGGSSTSQTTSSTEEIKITNPETGTTLGTDSVKVSGTTSKNHKVKVSLNGTKTFDATSDDSGNFEVQVTDIPSGDSVLKASVFDADGKTIGESTEVKIAIESALPKMTAISINPEGEVDAGTTISVEVLATSGLKEVSALIDDQVTKLVEKEDGKYTGEITAPTEAGIYNIDINLTDELGHKAENKSAKSITVKAMNTATAESGALSVGTGMILDKVNGLKLVKMKTKSILTWDAVKNAESYNIYKKDETSGEMKLITNVKEPRYEVNITGDQIKYEDFAVKAVGKDGDKTIESPEYSDMTKVQTGPAEIALAILALIGAGAFLYYRRRQA
ncbi:MAG: hypothetical protein PHR68_01560 [Candidatus Gracilibacteria bacterium]|nr:hypothetical protein [Candidatus Gracilibacteria bacterium]